MILEPIMEKYFVSASMAYDRDYSIFVRRPISAVILIVTAKPDVKVNKDQDKP